MHNLEHGYVAVLYRCPQGCDADFQSLRAWLKKQPSDPQLAGLVKQYPQFKPYAKIIIVPWPNMKPKFAAVAWDYYDPMDTADTTELQRFYDNHVGHSPEDRQCRSRTRECLPSSLRGRSRCRRPAGDLCSPRRGVRPLRVWQREQQRQRRRQQHLSVRAEQRGAVQPNPPKTNGKTDHAQVIPEMPHERVAPPTKVTYAHNPPTSGCHYSLGYGQAPIAAGAYPYTATIPAEYWVHNLEHGYMAVLYNCPKGCESQDFEEIRAWLKKLAPDPALVSLAKSQQDRPLHQGHLVVPWPSMTAKFAAVSSGTTTTPMDKVDTTELQAFFDNHLDTAPEGLNTP